MKQELEEIKFFFGDKFHEEGLTDQEKKEFVELYDDNNFKGMQMKMDAILEPEVVPLPEPVPPIMWEEDGRIMVAPDEEIVPMTATEVKFRQNEMLTRSHIEEAQRIVNAHNDTMEQYWLKTINPVMIIKKREE